MSDSVEGLKQRVVGAIVILSLAVIFLPMIFDKPHETESTTVVPIPPKPEIKTVTIKRPTKPELGVLSAEGDSGKVKIKKPVPVVEKEEPKTASKVKPKAEPESQAAKSSVKVDAKPSSVAKKLVPASPVSELPVFKNVWMVQLGTFSNKSNAYKLRDRLRKDGFDSHTKPISINGKPSVRVFSGPYVSKREAHKRKQKLDAKYGVKSLVLFFEA